MCILQEICALLNAYFWYTLNRLFPCQDTSLQTHVLICCTAADVCMVPFDQLRNYVCGVDEHFLQFHTEQTISNQIIHYTEVHPSKIVRQF